MKSRTLTCITAMTLFAALLILVGLRLVAQEQQQHRGKLQHYIITDLGTLGGTFSQANGINDRGEIAGPAFNTSTGELHGYLATPVPGSENVPPAAPGNNSERPKVVLPENVRKMLRQRMAQRYRIPGFGAPRH